MLDAVILSISFCVAHRHRVRHERTMCFGPGITVLAGPNGSGKSTVLRAIRHCPHCVVERDGEAPAVLLAANNADPQSTAFRRRTRADLVLDTRALFSSHGEIMRDVLSTITFDRGHTLLLDEPDNGQDAAWVERLRDALADAVSRVGAQVIVATHNPLLWEGGRLIELAPGYAAQVMRRYADAFERVSQRAAADRPVSAPER
jgi:predicted ATPase